MLRMALVHDQSMNHCYRIFEICFYWTCASACFSFLHPSGGCDHCDDVLRVVSRLCRDRDSLLEFCLLAVWPLPLELAI